MKIQVAVRKALEAVGVTGGHVPFLVAKAVTEQTEGEIPIDQVHDLVEKELTKRCFDAGRAYILYRQEHNVGSPDPNAIADFIFAAKYARWTGTRRETWNEAVDRVCDMHCRRFPTLEADIKNMFDFVHRKEVLPSMRSMQFAGPAIEEHNERMYNCTFTLVDRMCFHHIFYQQEQWHILNIYR